MNQIKHINEQRDGLRYPSIDELAGKSSSKYKLVIAAAKRGKEIDQTRKSYLPDTKNYKTIGIALEEIIADKVKVVD